MTKPKPRVVLVSDLAQVPERELLRRVDAVQSLPPDLRAGLAVQLRDVDLGARARFAFGQRLRAATRAVGAALFVNDRLDLAMLLEADGVHLRGGSVSVRDARAIVSDAFVSRACHSEADVVAAADEGADAAILAPIFSTPNKGAPLGPDALSGARAALDARGHAGFRLIALGGIGPAEARGCFAHGADGIAVIRADLGAALSACLAA